MSQDILVEYQQLEYFPESIDHQSKHRVEYIPSCERVARLLARYAPETLGLSR